jgi:hypothetical protein
MKEIVNTILRTDGVLEIYVGNRLFVEVEDGRSDKDFIEDVLYGMGYDWLEDGTIRPRVELPITKESIYDEMCRLLTDYEDMNGATEIDLYEMLVKIQRHWEDVITVQND